MACIFALGATCMKPCLSLIFLSIIFSTVLGQVNPYKDRGIVLQHNKVGKTYVFERSHGNDLNRTEITYLGNLKAKDGRVFKILRSVWYWGLAPRATNRIVVFDSRGRYLGNYYITMTYDLPSKIESNALVFEGRNRQGCNPDIVTRVSFTTGPPEQFFLECKNKMGDVYSFSNE